MSHTTFSKSAVCLLICVVFGLTLNNPRTAEAQCSTCVGQQVIVPEYLKFGVDPYNPRRIYPAPFTPLQLNWYQPVPTNNCRTCERSYGNLVPVIPPTTIDGPLVAPGEIEPATPDVAPADPDVDNENTASSPSDILLAPPAKPTEPTLADDASSENMAQLDEARKQITRLKAEVASAKEQSRVATERLYAAEKASKAARSKADESLEAMMKMRQQQAKRADDAAARQQEQQKKLDAVLQQLTELERLAEKAQKRNPKAVEGQSDAEKRLAKLKADAEKAGQEKMKKPRRPDQTKDDGGKKKQPSASADQQVKALQATMQRQIKNSSEKIRKRNQAAIKKLIDNGSKKSDPEVKELMEKMNSELKKNEAKIRKRIEERIQRIRKEAAARAIS